MSAAAAGAEGTAGAGGGGGTTAGAGGAAGTGGAGTSAGPPNPAGAAGTDPLLEGEAAGADLVAVPAIIALVAASGAGFNGGAVKPAAEE